MISIATLYFRSARPLIVAFTVLLITLVLAGKNIYAQDSHVTRQPLYNNVISIEQLEWQSSGPEAPITVSCTVKNNSETKTVRSVQLLLVVLDKKGIILQHKGVTLSRLTSTETIDPGASATLSFSKAFSIPQAHRLLLKEAVIEFTNGSLEILKN